MSEASYLWECPRVGCEYTRHMGPYETMGVWTPGCMVHQDTLLVPAETRIQRERAVLLEEFRQVCDDAVKDMANGYPDIPEWGYRMDRLLKRTKELK